MCENIEDILYIFCNTFGVEDIARALNEKPARLRSFLSVRVMLSQTLSIFSAFIFFAPVNYDAHAQPAVRPIATDSSVLGTETNPGEGLSSAGSKHSDDKTGRQRINGLQIDPCATAVVAGDTWLDETHDFVDRGICQKAVWFDNFFGRDNVLEEVRPGIFLKWRNSYLLTEGNKDKYVGDIFFQYRLPNMDRFLKKARLVFESRSDTDRLTTQPGQPVSPGLDPATRNRTAIIGVRADLLTYPLSLVGYDVGIRANWPPDPFIRARYQYTKPIGDAYLIRFKETALFRYGEHFTETSQLDFERKVNTLTYIRWSNYATYSQGTRGVTWNTGVSVITELTRKSAISYDASMWGVNHPEWTVQDYRVGIAYRRSIYRPWLFFEVEPEITWPKDADGRRNSVYAVMATLEVQFGR